jgi:pyruvate kinase
MLQSMVSAARPTRAEATDVANAVLDGTDAVMLSDETAIGVDPVRACRAMARIALAAQAALPESDHHPGLEGVGEELRDLAVFARAAVSTARSTGARAIVAWSRGGVAARLLSRERPRLPVLAPTRFEETWRRLALPWGVEPILCPGGLLPLRALEEHLGKLAPSDLLLVVGHTPGEERRIPWLSLVHVSDTEGWAVDPREGRGPAAR